MGDYPYRYVQQEVSSSWEPFPSRNKVMPVSSNLYVSAITRSYIGRYPNMNYIIMLQGNLMPGNLYIICPIMWAGIQFQRKQEFMPNYYASIRQMVTQKHGLTEQLLNSNEHFLSFVATTRIPPAQLLLFEM